MAGRKSFLLLAKKAKGHQAIDSFLRYNPLYRRHVDEAIRAFDAADLEGRADLTEQWTARILGQARRTPYGRSFGPGIEDWPILDKQRLRDDPESLRVPGLGRIPASTSGTTGSPIKLSRSMKCITAEQAFIDHILSPHGVSFRASRVAVLRGDDVKDPADREPPYGRVIHQGRRLMLSNPHLSPETVGWFVEAIRAFRPEILWVYPSMMANLLHCMELKALEFQVPVVLLSSEMLSPGAFRTIEQRLSARVVDYYGQAERVCFAAAQRPHEYRFLPSYGRVELVPEEAEEGGQPTARIYATGFWNTAMPLVRFDTGDRVILPARASGEDLRLIALGIAPFVGIAGRAAEFIVTPDGRAIASLNHLPREVENVFQLQVVQEQPDAIDIRVLPRPDFGETDRQQILHNARQKIPPEIAINIVVVSRLEKSPNGKVPFVIRRI